jgi:hypothetical protein
LKAVTRSALLSAAETFSARVAALAEQKAERIGMLEAIAQFIT